MRHKPTPDQHDHRANPISGAGPYMGMVQAEFRLADKVQQFLTSRSADLECKHGSLPDDTYIACGCWGEPRPKPSENEAS